MSHIDHEPFESAIGLPGASIEGKPELDRESQPASMGMWSGSIGGRRIVRALAGNPYGSLHLAYDPRREVDCMVWQFDGVDPERIPAVWSYLKRTVGQRKAHILPIDAAGRERGGLCWAVTPYVGNQECVVSLESLRQARGGVMTVFEVSRAIEQLLDASARCHQAGLVNGAIEPECVLVNPRGMLEIAMYGLSESIQTGENHDDLVVREVRSIGAIACQLLTGLTDTGAFQESSKASSGRALREWIGHACDPAGGFGTADEALRALPAGVEATGESPLGAARSLLGRLTSAVASGKTQRGNQERKNAGGSGVR